MPRIAVDFDSYYRFKETLSKETVERLRNRSFAAQCKAGGYWRIVDADENDDDLVKRLMDSDADLERIVFDRIASEEDFAGGVQLK